MRIDDRPANTLEGILQDCRVRLDTVTVSGDALECSVDLLVTHIAIAGKGNGGLPREQIKPGRVRITIEALP